MKGQNKNWCPAIELNETSENLILKAEVPGVEIHHLNISAETESISISGVHDQHKSKNEKELIPSQLHYGQLKCSVPLPGKIQADKVRAELIDGVLTITMPKMNVTSTVSF
ncbi:MAG: Hsp20/alpha crystallin family protein [Xenococcaceae cyanobacterium MO_188.B29]|nr:Hsp20/alpha crystallin family protein [Xenococcaceae cyanobacterium MO_188.B29]